MEDNVKTNVQEDQAVEEEMKTEAASVDTENAGSTETTETETTVNNTGTEEKVIVNVKTSEYTSVMDALFALKHGDQKMSRYAPLLFLVDMTYDHSKEWIKKALTEYKTSFYQEGEPRSWPIQRCLKVYQARKEKKEKKRLGQPG